MSETSRKRSRRQIWITRSHLVALGVATCCIALLAFMVGLQVGRGQAAAAEVATDSTPMPLTPDVDQEQALEALLREVEYARAAVGPGGQLASEAPAELSFPTLLEPVEPGTALPEDAADGSERAAASTVGSTPEEQPVAPSSGSASGGDLPPGGWAVQVASYPTLHEAEARIQDLDQRGYSAYRIAALVDGQTWYRVRIGGFSSQHRAESARLELARELDSSDLILAEAP